MNGLEKNLEGEKLTELDWQGEKCASEEIKEDSKVSDLNILDQWWCLIKKWEKKLETTRIEINA